MKKALIVLALVAMAIFGVMAYAGAAPLTPDPDVVVSATVNGKIVLQAPADFSLGSVDPDGNPISASHDVTVWSNIDYTLGGSNSGDGSGFSATDIDGAYAKSPASDAYPVTYSYDPSWAGSWQDAGTYSTTYTYTAVP